MSLERYQQKRDFARTPEPSGSVAAAPAGRARFVVQRHRARALHYDFRLEVDGVLASWAVPKGPTLDPGVRRAAFHVEDHPLDYYDFEGTIPRGEYGAGDVIVWDWGTFEPEATGDPGKALRDGELKLVLHGVKLNGRFTIVRTKGFPDDGGSERESWLLIKKRDEAAVPGWDPEKHLQSVKTGRTNDEVKDGVAPITSPIAPPGPVSGEVARPEDREAGTASAMPSFVEPMTATLTDRPFSNPDWLFEVKWDGYRVQAHIRDGKIRLYTRRGNDAASYFPELAAPPTWLNAREAILDGEVVALNAEGEPDFGLLQSRRSAARKVSDSQGSLAYLVFDLLYLDGRSLLGEPLEERKRLLKSLIHPGSAVQYSGHVAGDGEAFFEAVSERKLEGMMAKRRSSTYESGRRSTAWLKIKRRAEQEFVIGGWLPRQGAEKDLGALEVGVFEDGTLRPAGKVGTGFDARERARLMDLMAPLARGDSPFRPIPREKGIHWVEPKLVARVEFAEWTADGNLRAPAYEGLEIDADPRAVIRERPQAVTPASHDGGGAESPGPGATVKRDDPVTASSPVDRATPEELEALAALPAKGGPWSVGGRQLKLSNLDKVLWPEDGITKRELIRFYVSIAPYVLPYLRERALTLQRYPDGIRGPGFWQKQVPGHAPDWVRCWPIEQSTGTTDYLVADSVGVMAWIANEAAIDIHPSTFEIRALDRPTWALIDIDPGTKTRWEDILLMARLYRTALEHLHVQGFPKVSGQRGIQVWVPIKTSYSFDDTRDWVMAVSRTVGAAIPELVSWKWGKSEREGLARLDYTQNAWNKTLVAPYSVRPVKGAAVSAPISWDELDDPNLRPDRWTIRTIFERLAERGDLFAPALELRQELPAL